MDDKEENKVINKESKLVKRTYYLALAILVSFWCVVAVAGMKVSDYTVTLKESRVELEKIEKTVENLDMDSLNDTINTLNKVIKKLGL